MAVGSHTPPHLQMPCPVVDHLFIIDLVVTVCDSMLFSDLIHCSYITADIGVQVAHNLPLSEDDKS